MKPIYKICEHVNGLGESKYSIKFILDWWWPFWEPLTESMSVLFEYHGTKYFDSYDTALKVVNSLKQQDEKEILSKYKTKKCTIIK